MLREPILHDRARSMRRRPSDGERLLWHRLRAHRLGGHKFRRQVPVNGYILDFYCVASKLCVEVDGKQHAEPLSAAYDGKRTERLAQCQILVLRFSTSQVLGATDLVLAAIFQAANERAPSLAPIQNLA